MKNLIFFLALLLSVPAMAQRMLSREQAEADIDSLLYTIGEVHPNMFAVCNQGELLQMADSVKRALPDSLSNLELYKRIAPLVTCIGDGHTSLSIPYEHLLLPEYKMLPLRMHVTTDYRLWVDRCIDSLLPESTEVLAINGIPAKQLIESMLPHVSGEREFYRIDMLGRSLSVLYELLYHAPEHKVDYRLPNKKEGSITLQGVNNEQLRMRLPKRKQAQNTQAYSFRLLEDKRTAIMDFRSFSDPEGMRLFADSMFTTLREKGIDRLIIDVRENGGGNSVVGDILLQYLSPRPFAQMGKTLMRITPTTQRLNPRTKQFSPGWFYWSIEDNEAGLLQPHTRQQGHFSGKTILLTGHHTFSSAASFAWAFKHFGMGRVVGEETGGMNVCFGDIISYKLPHSNLQCSISFKRFWLYGADESDIHGTLPDKAVPASEAPEAALKMK